LPVERPNFCSGLRRYTSAEFSISNLLEIHLQIPLLDPMSPTPRAPPIQYVTIYDEQHVITDLAPKFYPVLSSPLPLDLPCWAVGATGAGAEPSA
jgi:hypothetical protein